MAVRLCLNIPNEDLDVEYQRDLNQCLLNKCTVGIRFSNGLKQELKLIAHTSGLSVCVATILEFWGSSLILLTWENIQHRPLERQQF